MKIVFVDIDGTLNSKDSILKSKEQYPNKEIRWDTPHPMHIEWLNKITDETGAYIVISSCWKTSFSVSGWNRYFDLLGVHGTVIACTPRLDSYRGTEINCWLMEHKSKIIKYVDSSWYAYKEPVESFAILDDDSDMEELMPYLVQTNSNYGLLEEHAIKAINILNKSIVNND